MIKLSYFTILVLVTVTLCYAQLQCYDCDPTFAAEECADPARNSVRLTNCQAKLNSSGEITGNSTIICLSAFIRINGDANNTGIYRGCNVLNADVDDFCDWFTQENEAPNRTIASCGHCNSSRCNSNTFNADGSINGAETIIGTLFFLVFNFLLSAVLLK